MDDECEDAVEDKSEERKTELHRVQWPEYKSVIPQIIDTFGLNPFDVKQVVAL